MGFHELRLARTLKQAIGLRVYALPARAFRLDPIAAWPAHEARQQALAHNALETECNARTAAHRLGKVCTWRRNGTRDLRQSRSRSRLRCDSRRPRRSTSFWCSRSKDRSISCVSSAWLVRIWANQPGEVWLLEERSGGRRRGWIGSGNLVKASTVRGSRSVNSAPWRGKEAVAGVILDDLEAKAVPLRLMQPIVAIGMRTVAEEDRGGQMKDARETLGAGLIRDHRITRSRRAARCGRAGS